MADLTGQEALAKVLRAHLAADRQLIKLHGHKGRPGYELMHSPNKKIKALADRVYAVGGQQAVTNRAVVKVSKGADPVDVVPRVDLHEVSKVPESDVPVDRAQLDLDIHAFVAELKQGLRIQNGSLTNSYLFRRPETKQKLTQFVDQLKAVRAPTISQQQKDDDYQIEGLQVLVDLHKDGVTTSATYNLSDQELRAQINRLQDILQSGPNAPVYYIGRSQIGETVEKAIQELRDDILLPKRVAALPFDLQNASRTVRSAYVSARILPAASKAVGSMPKPDQIRWIEAHLLRDLDLKHITTQGRSMEVKVPLEMKALASAAATQAKLAANRAAKQAAIASANAAPAAAIQPAFSPTKPGLDAPSPVIHAGSVALTFTRVTNGKKLPGIAEKYEYEDQLGNRWLFKPELGTRGGMPGQFRTDMEHAAHLIGNHLGFDHAESRILTLEGKRGQIQRMFSGTTGDFVGVDVTQLTGREMQDVLDEHLIDWLIANHDGHTENLLRLNNGTVVGIDKGAAFKFFGKDKLKAGYATQPALKTKDNPVDLLYAAIANGDLSQDKVDELTRSVLRRAARMQLASDDPVRDIMSTAQATRPKGASTFRESGPQSAEALTKALLDRKAALLTDFTKFYQDLYAKAGLKWTDDLIPDLKSDKIGKVEGVYSGVSDSLLADVHKSQVHGVASMFAGTDIEDGHILFWEEQWKGAGSSASIPTLRGTLTTREEADTRVTSWLRANVGSRAGAVAVHAAPQTASDLVLERDWWAAIEAVAKSYSVSVKRGSYSDRRVQQLADLHSAIDTNIRHYEGLSKTQQREYSGDGVGWLAMAQKYKADVAYLEQTKVSGTKPALLERYVYTPPKKPVGTTTSPAQLAIKVSKVTNTREGGTVDAAAGVLTVDPMSRVNSRGEMFKVEIGSDFEIDYLPWVGLNAGSAQVADSQQGILRIAAKNYSGKAVDLEPVWKTLREMGLTLKPAERDDLELLYWRNTYGNMSGKSDAASTYSAVLAAVRTNLRAGMSPAAEITVYRDAFAQVMPQARVDESEWRPQFSHTRIQEPKLETGRPYWYRPDLVPGDMKALLKTLPTHAISSDAGAVAMSGQLLSVEERLRVTSSTGSAYSPSGMHGNQASFGAAWIYTQFGRTPSQVTFGQGNRGAMVLLNPNVARRTSSWNLDSMQGGNIALRRLRARFDVKSWTAGNHNVIHVKNSMSYLDDVEVASFKSRRELDPFLKMLRDNGITQIRGLPIEDRFVLVGSAEFAAASAKAWAAYQAHIAGTSYAPPRSSAKPGAAYFDLAGAVAHAMSWTSGQWTSRSQKNPSKGFLNGVKTIVKMNAPVMGTKYAKTMELFNHPSYALSSPMSMTIWSHMKMQPLIEKDEINFRLLQRYLSDPALLAAAPPPEVWVLGNKPYLAAGLEQFYARRLMGATRVEVVRKSSYMPNYLIKAAGL